jgi:hypothetical protein
MRVLEKCICGALFDFKTKESNLIFRKSRMVRDSINQCKKLQLIMEPLILCFVSVVLANLCGGPQEEIRRALEADPVNNEFLLDKRSPIERYGDHEYIVVTLYGKGGQFDYYEDVRERGRLWESQTFKVSSRCLIDAADAYCGEVGVTILGFRNGENTYEKFCVFDRSGKQIFPEPPAEEAPKKNNKESRRYGRSNLTLFSVNP